MGQEPASPARQQAALVVCTLHGPSAFPVVSFVQARRARVVTCRLASEGSLLILVHSSPRSGLDLQGWGTGPIHPFERNSLLCRVSSAAPGRRERLGTFSFWKAHSNSVHSTWMSGNTEIV